jgi:hypothetical protein
MFGDFGVFIVVVAADLLPSSKNEIILFDFVKVPVQLRLYFLFMILLTNL